MQANEASSKAASRTFSKIQTDHIKIPKRKIAFLSRKRTHQKVRCLFNTKRNKFKALYLLNIKYFCVQKICSVGNIGQVSTLIRQTLKVQLLYSITIQNT